MNKTVTRLLLASAAAVAFFTACDNISEDERYIEMPVAKANRTVLLEDFTGQNCKNCPNAHEAIHALQEQYGDALIAVSIHPAGNGLVYDESRYGAAGLGTEDGRDIATAAGAGNQLPIGQVDRSTGLLDYNSWSKAVYDAVNRETSLTITGTATIADSLITVKIETLPAVDFKGRLHVWVLEDSVVARQLLPDGKRDNNYVHNHLLRQCITGPDGILIDYSHAVYESDTFTHRVKAHWNDRHLRLIAFFTNPDGNVEQAINIIPAR